MARDPQQKAELRAAYLSGLSLPAACDKAGIPFDTGKKWKQTSRSLGDDWDKLRSAMLLSDGGLESVMQSILAATMSETLATLEMLKNSELQPLQRVDASAKLGDSVFKLHNITKRLAPETDALGERLTALKLFAAYVSRVKPEALEVLAELIEGFGKELVSG